MYLFLALIFSFSSEVGLANGEKMSLIFVELQRADQTDCHGLKSGALRIPSGVVKLVN